MLGSRNSSFFLKHLLCSGKEGVMQALLLPSPPAQAAILFTSAQPSLHSRSARFLTPTTLSHLLRRRIFLLPRLGMLSWTALTTKSPMVVVAAPIAGYTAADEELERAKLTKVSRRLENTSRYFKQLGAMGFWGQLVCAVASAVILSFSSLITGKVTSPITFYTTAAGIVAAFVSVFWSFGYIRLSERLLKTAKEPAKAPPHAGVVKSLKNGIVLNVLGMGAAILGMQATVGTLFGKALTNSSVPYYQGITPGQSPVLALDLFLVQASANTILSHFLGLVSSLELLRSITSPSSQDFRIPKAA
ncbi:hypothetical protein HPP92_004357 [Vanilla planifolia]|uniref:Protein TIC 21, chloroplastic n=1 Tax=Vanilla planifolia TaxID=51239 RepID=A0A835RMN5_VANPL|nr:hypothetical protein HPP92_004357 [Vanilla planifolia]